MRATQTFHALGRLTVEGDELPADDDVVKAFPSLFVDDAPTLVRPESVDKAITRPARKVAARKAAPKAKA